MKKTLLSVIIASAATSVGAIEVYNENGTTVNLNGEIAGIYERWNIKESSSKILEHRYGNTMDRNEFLPIGSLTISGSSEIGNDFEAFASFKVKGDTSTETKEPIFKGDFKKQKIIGDLKEPGYYKVKDKGSYARKESIKVQDVVVGVRSDNLTLSVGQTDSSMDILSAAKMTNRLELTYDSFSDANEGRGVRYQYQIDDLAFSFDYQDFIELKNGEDYVSASLVQKLDDFKIGATYTHVTEGANDGSVAGIMAAFESNGVKLAATFAKFEGYKLPVICDLNMDRTVSNGEREKTLSAYFDATLLTVGASYEFNGVRMYTAYQRADSDRFAFNEWQENGIEMIYDTYQLGAEYTFNKNFRVFAEGTYEDSEWGPIKTGRTEYALGAIYQF